ncbi:SUMF1/EgtB/PvdO family nonheme iron enzyme [Streptomyces sp. NPDC093707]|uniref:formylglycine-generating enzyme family protein n=1 Tax=Streptomyces sp. NPDC093707 TaxID=3154984 RepID=UPI00344DAA85
MTITDIRAMVRIPAATVAIGAPEHHLDSLVGAQHYGRSWFEDESPQQMVSIKAYLLDRYPVTNAQFADFVAATGYRTAAERRGFGLVYGENYWISQPGACWRCPGGPHDDIHARMNHPVVHVDYADAAAFAHWADKRLPTEAEWEYAAHGPAWRCWPWGDTWDPQRAVTCDSPRVPVADFAQWRIWWKAHYTRHGTTPGTVPVGTRSPGGDSPFGVADMAGHVSEWTASPYQLYDPTRAYEPIYHAAAGRYRTIRGGGWMHFRYQTRTTERFTTDPAYSNHAIGFRCAANDRKNAAG